MCRERHTLCRLRIQPLGTYYSFVRLMVLPAKLLVFILQFPMILYADNNGMIQLQECIGCVFIACILWHKYFISEAHGFDSSVIAYTTNTVSISFEKFACNKVGTHWAQHFYKIRCTSSEDSGQSAHQSAHLCSLIRIVTGHSIGSHG